MRCPKAASVRSHKASVLLWPTHGQFNLHFDIEGSEIMGCLNRAVKCM